MKKGLYLIVFLLTIEGMSAQWRKPQLYHFGADEGFTSGVRDIDQDEAGYMYFATHQGMFRYDGNKFIFFGHDSSDSNSISSGHVFDVHVSKDQKVYLALFNSYLNVFDPSTQYFSKFEIPHLNTFDTQMALSLAEDVDGYIWIGGENYQLYRFDPKSEQFTTYSVPWVSDIDKNGRYKIQTVYQDPDDKNILWLTVRNEVPQDIDYTDYGLVKFNKNEEIFTKVNGAGNVRIKDHDGHLWGTLWGEFITEMDPQSQNTDIHSYLNFYEKLPDKKTEFPGVSHDIVQYQNQLLVANGDILSFDGKRKKFDFFYDYNNGKESTKLFIDNANNLWIGLKEGIEIYNPKYDQIAFYSLSDLGEDKIIYPGRIAYNSENKSFYFIASTSNNFSKIYQIPHPKFYKSKPLSINTPVLPIAILPSSDNSMLIVGEGKMYDFNITSKRYSENAILSADMPIPFLYKLIKNNRWSVGFGHDKIIWWDKNMKSQHIQIDELQGDMDRNFYSNLEFFDQNHLIVTTRSDVFSIDLQTGEHRLMSISMETPFSYITGLDVDKSQNIWISSLSKVVRFTKEKDAIIQDKSYALKEGITSPTIQEIFIDKAERVWIFHQSGMNCLNPETDEIRTIGSREGLPHSNMDPVQIVETDDGYLATDCSNGLIIWHPDSLWNSLDPPTVQIEFQSLQVNGKAHSAATYDDNIPSFQLPKGPKVITVKYQGLAYPTDKKVMYSYRIVNQGNEWISSGNNNQLILSELPFGKNILEIKAGTPSVNSPFTRIILQNPTPILSNPWLYILTSLLLFFGIFKLYKWRIKELKKREEQKTFYNKKVAELELTALRSQMNPHFMFNSLNSIKSYILEAKPEIAAQYLSQFSHLIRLILQNSREKRLSLEEEIDTLNLYIQLEQIRFENAFDFNINIDSSISLSDVMLPPMLLQPFVENAIWHGLIHKEEKGELYLEFTKHKEHISCIIEDNGIGRVKAKSLKSMSARKFKSMGMNITQHRVQLLNTIDSLGISLEIVDKYNQDNISTGTKVILLIPISTDD